MSPKISDKTETLSHTNIQFFFIEQHKCVTTPKYSCGLHYCDRKTFTMESIDPTTRFHIMDGRTEQLFIKARIIINRVVCAFPPMDPGPRRREGGGLSRDRQLQEKIRNIWWWSSDPMMSMRYGMEWNGTDDNINHPTTTIPVVVGSVPTFCWQWHSDGW